MSNYIAQVRINGSLVEVQREGLANTFSWCNAVMNTGNLKVDLAVVKTVEGWVIANYHARSKTWVFEE